MELSGIRYVDELNVESRYVFVRVDFNVPLEDGKIVDDARIQAALPTIRHLRSEGARIILASHLGRPKGKVVESLSLAPAGERLAELLETDVLFPDDCVGDGVRKVIRDISDGGIVLLENLRFHQAETKNDPLFSTTLAHFAEFYVNDAFGAAHRAHASTYGIASHFAENRRAAGFLIKSELQHLAPLLEGPERPFVGILGGAKVSDKMKVIDQLIGKLDTLLIGGAMAYTFLKAQGVPVGDSLFEADKVDLARQLLSAGERRRTRILLPSDHITAASMDAAEGQVTKGTAIAAGQSGFDIGPKTIEAYTAEIAKASTVFWNGPLGVFEREPFSKGTFAVANAMADASATTVVGGGDSAAALKASGRIGDVTHVSTGGGASLEFIEGADLPGVAALRSGHRFKES